MAQYITCGRLCAVNVRHVRVFYQTQCGVAADIAAISLHVLYRLYMWHALSSLSHCSKCAALPDVHHYALMVLSEVRSAIVLHTQAHIKVWACCAWVLVMVCGRLHTLDPCVFTWCAQHLV